MNADPRATLAALVERAANLLGATGDLGLGETWATTFDAVNAARATLAQPATPDPVYAAAERLVRAHSSLCDSGGCGCGAQGRVGLAFSALRAAVWERYDQMQPAHPRGQDAAPAGETPRFCVHIIEAFASIDVLASQPCGLPLPCAVHDARPACRRKVLAAMVSRYLADAGPPETPEARAALDLARAWSERCAVCGEDEPDAPRVAGRERHVYCSDACAESADCRACLGDGFEGPRENDVPCGECRSSDRLHYEAQQDEDARDNEEQRRVGTARDAELEGGS